MIIFLNGTSSAGKTTLARALQTLHPTPLLYLGVDTFCNMLPSQYLWYAEKADEGVKINRTENKDGTPHIQISSGPVGKQLFHTIPHVVATFAQHQHDIIVDEVLLSTPALHDYARALAPYTVYFIKVHNSLTNERERARGDRTIGMATSQAKLVHSHGFAYDLSIDTTDISPKEGAQQIRAFIAQHPKPTAFAAIATQTE